MQFHQKKDPGRKEEGGIIFIYDDKEINLKELFCNILIILKETKDILHYKFSDCL
jgi:hypothetical protein